MGLAHSYIMKIKDFYSFAGLNFGETVDQVFDLFGIPDDEYKNPDNSYFVFYYMMNNEFALNISFSSTTFKIESIFLGLHSWRAVRNLLEKYRIDEPKACFIGKSMDEVIDLFGIPDKRMKNYITYTKKKIEVEFYYPGDERSYCRRIKVRWFYPREV
jgi:hypothetical protein